MYVMFVELTKILILIHLSNKASTYKQTNQIRCDFIKVLAPKWQLEAK